VMLRLFLIRQQIQSIVTVPLSLRLVDKNHQLKSSGVAELNK
jgi:hypothetical protein